MWKVGITSSFPINDENLSTMRASGVEAMELNLAADKPCDHKEVAELAKKHDILLWSCHLPFLPREVMNFAIPDAALHKAARARHTELIQKGTEIGIDKFVIHPSTPIPEGLDREECKKYSMESLDYLAEVAHRYGAVLAVEDMILSCLGNSAAELMEIISVNDKLRVCFDTNHLFHDTQVEFARKLGDKIITMHVNDYDFIQERHWMPGEGKIDWYAVADIMQEIGYKGVWLYEFGFSGRVDVRGRELTPADYRRNATEIFTKQPLTVIKP